ncbi:MAG TPA: hypothetical protein VGT02_15890 [Methylomirabilota bacterium]|nr:hypothetical protein [Methylomirabilota bacterium]
MPLHARFAGLTSRGTTRRRAAYHQRAPFLVNALRWATTTAKKEHTVDYRGRVWTGVGATIVTLWGVIGQILTLSVLTVQFGRETIVGGITVPPAMSSWTAGVLQGLLVVALIGLGPHVWQAIRKLVAASEPNTPAPPALVGAAAPRLPGWSVL